MLRLLTLWIDLCLLRAGPQDVPASRVLLVLVLCAYALVSFVLSLTGYPPQTAARMAGVDLLLLAVFAGVPLYLLDKTARIRQTLAALAGSGALLGIIALPVAHMLPAEQGADTPLLAALAWLVLLGWSLLVMAHIMRHAMAVAFPIGLGVAVLYTLVATQVFGTLFAPDTT